MGLPSSRVSLPRFRQENQQPRLARGLGDDVRKSVAVEVLDLKGSVGRGFKGGPRSRSEPASAGATEQNLPLGEGALDEHITAAITVEIPLDQEHWLNARLRR